MKATIEAKLVTAMKADSDLDGIAVFCRGLYIYPPRNWYPLAEVFIPDESQTSRGTGGFVYNEFVGFIQVSVRIPDKPAVTDREAVVSSYTSVQSYVSEILLALGTPALLDLDTLTRADGLEVVMSFEMADQDSISYGIESRDRLGDNFNNFGIVPFRVETREDRS